jgi:hypothetical protein
MAGELVVNTLPCALKPIGATLAAGSSIRVVGANNYSANGLPAGTAGQPRISPLSRNRGSGSGFVVSNESNPRCGNALAPVKGLCQRRF